MIYKLEELAKTKRLLIVGDIKEDFSKIFKEVVEYKFSSETMDLLERDFYDEFDVIIFHGDIEAIYEEFIGYKTIIISENVIISDYFNKIEFLYEEYDEYDLFVKIAKILTLNKFTTFIDEKCKLKNSYEIDENLESFLDEYSGSIAFINDELEEILKKLKNYEFSDDIFKTLSKILTSLSFVYAKNDNLKSIEPIFTNFAYFLDNLELDKVSPENFEFFDYLTNILEDIYNYNNELFIFRVFNDVYIFEHSLQNNIDYFKSLLLGNKVEDDEDVEFF